VILSWMLYATIVSIALGAGARAMEWACERSGRSLRWSWVAAFALSFAIPIVGLIRDPRSGAGTGSGDNAMGAVVRLPAMLVSLSGVAPYAGWSRVDTVVGMAWAIASVVLLLFFIRSRAALHRASSAWQSATIGGDVVLISESVGPAVIGGRHPRIILPRWMLALDAGRRNLVLAHEREHIVARDSAILMLSRTFTALVPWNPLLWVFERRLRHAIEIDCDRRVLSVHADPAAYGETLLFVAERSVGSPRMLATLSEPFSLLERRITAMTESAPRRRFTLAIGAAGAAIALVVACQSERPTIPGEQPLTEGKVTSAAIAAPLIADANAPFFEFQVEQPVQAIPGGGQPRYPDIMRQAGVEGEVLLQFVVDTSGRVEMESFKVLKTTHELFANAVRDVLPGMRYSAARIGGRAVRQVVQQPFMFALSRQAELPPPPPPPPGRRRAPASSR
jgi:TonB family protein